MAPKPYPAPPTGNAKSSREITWNLLELHRLPTIVENRATSFTVIVSAGFQYQLQSVIHICERAFGQDVRLCGRCRPRGVVPPSRGGNLAYVFCHIKRILGAGGKILQLDAAKEIKMISKERRGLTRKRGPGAERAGRVKPQTRERDRNLRHKRLDKNYELSYPTLLLYNGR